MKSFRLSLVKFILGFFLFGLAVFANPIEGYCISPNTGTGFSNGSYNFNNAVTIDLGLSNFNVNINGPVNQYGLVPFSSFDVTLNFEGFAYTPDSNLCFFTEITFDVYVLFSSTGNGAYSEFLGAFNLSDSFINSPVNTREFRLSSSVEGIPTGIRVEVRGSEAHLYTESLSTSDGVTISYDYNQSGTFFLKCVASFSNFSFVESDGSFSGGNTIINNTTGNLVPIGYSSLNFGLNGSIYFLGASRIFDPSYLSPLMFSYDFSNSVQGVVSSAPLTLAMGGYDSPPNTAHASPIAVIGDTRAGEYELTIALCLSNSPSSSQLLALTNLSNWGFEFNRGYSGQQFSMPSDARISYTNFTDSKTGYVYTSIYFYFTTPDYFDSFLIRKAPSLNNIRVGAFAFNKYTGTISDQLFQSNQQWDYQNPSHNSFSSANSSAASTVSAFSNIESDAFLNLDTAMSGAGVNDFNINVISSPLATVSGMINQTYNILPDLIKWLILAILVIGIFAVIISANNYVNKD